MLTENGRVELVVRAAVSYQEILERLERAETLAVIRKGMRQFKRGEGSDSVTQRKTPKRPVQRNDRDDSRTWGYSAPLRSRRTNDQIPKYLKIAKHQENG